MADSLDAIVKGATSKGASDDEVLLDFSEAVEFEQYEVGRKQPAVVVDAFPDKSKKGNPVLVVEFEFTDGANKGRKIKRSCPTTGKGSGIAKSTIKGCGLDPDVRPFKAASLKGAKVLLDVRFQKDNDDFTEINRVAPQG